MPHRVTCQIGTAPALARCRRKRRPRVNPARASRENGERSHRLCASFATRGASRKGVPFELLLAPEVDEEAVPPSARPCDSSRTPPRAHRQLARLWVRCSRGGGAARCPRPRGARLNGSRQTMPPERSAPDNGCFGCANCRVVAFGVPMQKGVYGESPMPHADLSVGELARPSSTRKGAHGAQWRWCRFGAMTGSRASRSLVR
jgi:hypothetical protein